MGVYRFLSFPFEISTAPGEYQARMAHQVLEGFNLNGAIVYTDDTVIYGLKANSVVKPCSLIFTNPKNKDSCALAT